MNTAADESGAVPALVDEGEDESVDAARADVVGRDAIEVANENMMRVGDAFLLLREELEDERACSRMLRIELAKERSENAKLRTQLARRDARLAKTA